MTQTRMGNAAVTLMGVMARVAGWPPDIFWNATPADVRAVLAGRDALAVMPTGAGKSLLLRALADRTGIDTADVDDIIWGTSSQRGPQSGDLGRMSALDAGYAAQRLGLEDWAISYFSRALADWPAAVRGFGPVREHAAEQASARRQKARSALMT